VPWRAAKRILLDDHCVGCDRNSSSETLDMNLSLRWRMLFGALVVVFAASSTIGQNESDKKAGPEKKVENDKKAQPGKKAAKKSFTVTIAGEIDAKLTPIAGKFVTEFYDCYPRLVERFENPKKPAPRDIKITFAHIEPPAYCTGSEIKVSVDWLHKHPDDVGVITHELTHSVQGYPRGVPGWFTEGMAEYARHVFGPKDDGWSLPRRLNDKQSYKDSYRVTGRFLVWLEEKHPGVVDKLHRKAQDREFDVADFRTFTGSSVDELWTECVKSLRTPKEQPKEKEKEKEKSP
jgi:Peptidase of plants and bacteria